MANPQPKETIPLYTAEWIATPPSCPPLVGGFGAETPEVKEAREARGEPAPKPLLMTTGGQGTEPAKPAPHPAEPPAQPPPASETKASSSTRK